MRHQAVREGLGTLVGKMFCERLATLVMSAIGVCVAGEDMVATTPSMSPYSPTRAEETTVVDLFAREAGGDCQLSTETPTHTVIPRDGPAARSMMHTRSSHVLALGIARHGDHSDLSRRCRQQRSLDCVRRVPRPLSRVPRLQAPRRPRWTAWITRGAANQSWRSCGLHIAASCVLCSGTGRSGGCGLSTGIGSRHTSDFHSRATATD